MFCVFHVSLYVMLQATAGRLEISFNVPLVPRVPMTILFM